MNNNLIFANNTRIIFIENEHNKYEKYIYFKITMLYWKSYYDVLLLINKNYYLLPFRFERKYICIYYFMFLLFIFIIDHAHIYPRYNNLLHCGLASINLSKFS